MERFDAYLQPCADGNWMRVSDLFRLLSGDVDTCELTQDGCEDDGMGGETPLFVHKECINDDYVPIHGYSHTMDDRPVAHHNASFCPGCGTKIADASTAAKAIAAESPDAEGGGLAAESAVPVPGHSPNSSPS